MSHRGPSPAEFAGHTMEQDTLLYAEAPWLHEQAVLHPETWRSYVDQAGNVPGGISARALESFEWLKRC